MTKGSLGNLRIMTKTRMIQIWCWWMLVLIQRLHSSLTQVQFMSLCNRTLPMSASLSIIFTPVSSRSCCNVTVIEPRLSNSSEQIVINLNNTSPINTSLKLLNHHMQAIELINYSSYNRTLTRTDIIQLPVTFSLCRFDLPPFEILITNISKGSCGSNQYRCIATNHDQWCVDEILHCDGYHSCPEGIDEMGCSKSMSRLTSPKMKRTIRGGVVTTIIIFGLLLIVSSVSIAVAFVYFQRKRQRRRQFTYSLESTSDEWEPSRTGYHLFDNWSINRRHPPNTTDTMIVNSNEHMPITTATTTTTTMTTTNR